MIKELFIRTWKVLVFTILSCITLGAVIAMYVFKKDTDRDIEVSFLNMRLEFGEE